MKKIYQLIPSILFALTSQAQPLFERAFHLRNEGADAFIMSLNGDLIFMTEENTPGFFYGQTYLYKYSSSGTLLLKQPVLDTLMPLHGIENNEHAIITVGYNDECHAYLPIQINYISKVDDNGSMVFASTYTVKLGDFPVAVVQLQDSSYMSFTDSLLIKHSKQGQLVWKKNLGFNQISSALVLNNSSGNVIVSAAQNFTPTFFEISPGGNVVSSKTAPNLVKNLTYYTGQQMIGTWGGYFFKFSPALEPIGSSLSSLLTVHRFITHNDSIYAIRSAGGIPTIYSLLDTNFTVLHSAAPTTSNMNPQALCLHGSRIAMVSTGLAQKSTSGFQNHGVVSVEVINKNGSNNFINDLELSALITDTAYATPYFNIPNTFHTYFKASARVKNKGNTVINSFKLNSFISLSAWCGSFFYQEEFKNLALAPGDSLTVPTNSVIHRMQSSNTAMLQLNQCYYVTVPNGMTDKTFADNELCKTETIIITDLNEIEQSAITLDIFPNPSDQVLNISSNKSIQRIQIIGVLGEEVEFYETDGSKLKLNTEKWKSGIYILLLETSAGTVIKKVVKN